MCLENLVGYAVADQIGLSAALLFTVTLILVVFVNLLVAVLFLFVWLPLHFLPQCRDRTIAGMHTDELRDTLLLRFAAASINQITQLLVFADMEVWPSF